MMQLKLRVLPGNVAVCRLAADAPVPSWATGSFTSITRTHAELSIMCDEAGVPHDVRADRDWRVLEVAGPFAFDVTGVAAALTAPLAANGISVLPLSTFDTDYLLVKQASLDRAADALRAAGHDVA